MIPQDGDRRYANPDEGIQQRLHFAGLPVVGPVACEHKDVGVITHLVEFIAQCGLVGRRKVQIGGGRDSHWSITRRRDGTSTRGEAGTLSRSSGDSPYAP